MNDQATRDLGYSIMAMHVRGGPDQLTARGQSRTLGKLYKLDKLALWIHKKLRACWNYVTHKKCQALR